MKNTLKQSFFALSAIILLGGATSCENTDPSVAKVYVRSANKQLVEGAQVVIIGDVQNPTETVEYVDTAFTNSAGYAQFAMDAYFTKAGADKSEGVFDLVVKNGDDKAEDGDFRVRVHNVAVRTVTFD